MMASPLHSVVPCRIYPRRQPFILLSLRRKREYRSPFLALSGALSFSLPPFSPSHKTESRNLLIPHRSGLPSQAKSSRQARQPEVPSPVVPESPCIPTGRTCYREAPFRNFLPRRARHGVMDRAGAREAHARGFLHRSRRQGWKAASTSPRRTGRRSPSSCIRTRNSAAR